MEKMSLHEIGVLHKTEQSEGNMYPAFMNKYGARYCTNVLGEHR